MSDQDFFFDEEDEKPARTAKSSGGKTPAKTPAKAPAKTPAKAAAAKQPETVAGGTFFDRNLNMGIASLLVVCALLVGMVVGVLVGQARANSALLAAPSAVAPVTGGQAAPQLTEEQLNSGQLPAGHPSVGTTASAETSSGK